MKTTRFLFILLFIAISYNSFSQCWKEIVAGAEHTIALKTDGTLWAWGNNDNGQLGDGTTISKNIPTQIGTDADWAIIESQGASAFAIKTDGSLWGWGINSFGQLGDGNFGFGVISTIPSRIGLDNDWIKVTSGSVVTHGIKSNGTLWGWGKNTEGRLGTGDFLPHYTPFQIGTDSDWIDVNSGGNQTLAIKANNTIWGWGLNKAGSLAIGPPSESNYIITPTQTGNNSSDWAKIEVGGCCGSKLIKTAGTHWAMGLGTNGNIGNGDTQEAINTPTQVNADTDWKSIATFNHTCAIKNNGTLWAWGANFQGQIGDGTFINRTTPIQIGTNITWKTVKAGAFHTVALSSANTLYAWGWNNYGQLGDGTLIDKAVITQIGNACLLSSTEFETIQSLLVVPNPTANFVTVHFLISQSADVTCTITNALGQIVYNKITQYMLGKNQESIDLNALATGVYYLSLRSNNQLKNIKIIKK